MESSFSKSDKSRSHPAVSVALIPDSVRFPSRVQLRLVQRDGLGQGHPLPVQIGGIVQRQPAPESGVDLHRLGEELRPPAPGLNPSVP